MKSMTGYGRGESTQQGFKITIEISSVNRKQSEMGVYLPRELELLEPQARDEINKRIARGRLTVKGQLQAASNGLATKSQINRELAKAYASELRSLALELGVTQSISLELLAQVPGVFQADASTGDVEQFWPALRKALHQALDALVAMRSKEGDHLAKDLQGRVRKMRKMAMRIQKRAPQMVKRYRAQLRERIANAGLPLPPEDDERLLREVVYFADRSDITEELTRLTSHFKQFDDCVRSTEPIGRTLDFLAQEMNREINTIGSKANDAEIAHEVVSLKAELEKFREQVQNVE